MNIFIVHSGTEEERAEEIKNKISSINDKNKKRKKANVIVLKHEKNWKRKARKLIKTAQIILCVLSKNGQESKNIDWEIKQAKKHGKAIVVLREDESHKPFDVLLDKDVFTNESFIIGKEVKSVDEVIDIIEDYENGGYIHLFNDENLDPEKLFEQYKLFSDTSESLVTRRQNVNSFYITANTALITIAATIFSANDNLFSQLIITMVLSFPGILLNRSWLKVMESYALVNSSKMKILGMIEKKLSASLYDAEWEVMSNEYNMKKYISFSDRERNLPIIFNWVFASVDVVCVIIILVKFVFKL